LIILLLVPPPPPLSTLLPYTTLFRSALALQPFEQPAQLGAQHGLIVETAEQRLDGVDHDALGADGIDGKSDADEQAIQIIIAGRSEEHTSELQSHLNLVCRLLLEKKM